MLSAILSNVEHARRPGSRRGAHRRTNRPGFRLGIGAGAAITKLLLAALCSALLVLAFVDRWSVFVLVPIGAIWAIVFAGLIVVPIIASYIADSLGQHGGDKPFSPPDRGYDTDSWAPQVSPPTYPPANEPEIGPDFSALKGPISRPLAVGMASGFDWEGFVEAVADRLETALGEGYSASGDGAAFVLQYGETVRKVNLRSIFQPPPLEVGERALRGCLKMMDEAQMFSMRVRQRPWPSREGSLNGGPGNLARPRVRLDDGEIRMVWADDWGTVLRLRPLPFDGSSARGRDVMGRDVSW